MLYSYRKIFVDGNLRFEKFQFDSKSWDSFVSDKSVLGLFYGGKTSNFYDGPVKSERSLTLDFSGFWPEDKKEIHADFLRLVNSCG